MYGARADVYVFRMLTRPLVAYCRCHGMHARATRCMRDDARREQRRLFSPDLFSLRNLEEDSARGAMQRT